MSIVNGRRVKKPTRRKVMIKTKKKWRPTTGVKLRMVSGVEKEINHLELACSVLATKADVSAVKTEKMMYDR